MSFLTKIFGRQTDKKQASLPADKNQPDNETLLNLLHEWKNNESAENYTNVVNELLGGQSYLLLPSANDGKSNGWKTLKPGMPLKLTSVYDVDGLKILATFTDESALLTWARKQTEFTAMRSQDVIEFCQTQGIDRIVINRDQPTMFVLERNRDNIKGETVQKETKVQIWALKNPISGQLLAKLKSNFSKVSSIREVYHFGMTRNNEHVMILAFALDIYSENSRIACIHAIQNAMGDEAPALPLELFYLEDQKWYNTARNVENSLIYSRR